MPLCATWRRHPHRAAELTHAKWRWVAKGGYVEQYRRAIFTDPVHQVLDFGHDAFTRSLTDIIDAKVFQRLRRISQLGLASHVFPGATHTRFLHSLGAAHLAQLVMRHLAETDDRRHQQADVLAYERTVTVSALLHDIGHGPFSHVFERVKMAGDKQLAPDHEEWGKAIINEMLASLIEATDVDPKHVAAIISRSEQPLPVPMYAKQIVSSQLDVDRLDYLPRDAHFAGVAMGQVDVGYLVRSMTLIRVGKQTCLGLSKKGVRPYEAFALARHHMHRSVYLHPKVRVLEFMLCQFLRCVLEEAARDRSVPQYLRSLASLKDKADEKFVRDNLEHYTAMTEDVIWSLVSEFSTRRKGKAPDLARRLLTRNVFDFSLVRRGMRHQLATSLESQGGTSYEILPADSWVYKGNSDAVLVARGDRSEPISSESLAIALLMDRPDGDAILIALDNNLEDLKALAAGTLVVEREARREDERSARGGKSSDGGTLIRFPQKKEPVRRKLAPKKVLPKAGLTARKPKTNRRKRR